MPQCRGINPKWCWSIVCPTPQQINAKQIHWNRNIVRVTALVFHWSGVIMGAMVSQITSLTLVYSTVYSGADQRKHQSSASLAFVRGIHRWPVNSPHKWPVTRNMFPFDDVIMIGLIQTTITHNINDQSIHGPERKLPPFRRRYFQRHLLMKMHVFAQRPVTRSFDIFFGLSPNKRLSEQWWSWWFETPSSPLWRHCDVILASQPMNATLGLIS